ncbi:MAG TPA: TrmB family transcriptional regulator [Candidatus Eisenbergiella merdipullorum]|uniref:TrmB family transcriptional regulator n=1 Tax=Candidatus Eisenbergiella merdipullorum TaxID=2838553 RepID=A0A9D2L1P4_9FIRM|nr:TrmB family transcriptional regulator [Candidatus Eisenbergiella merdipullorum]
MDDMVFVEKLMTFGLTRQEASIYLCLYRNGTLTGYEAAKITGISRSNVYNALAGLTEKGAAYLMEGSSSRYMAVPVGELCDNKLRALSEAKSWLEQNMPQASSPSEGYITIVGGQQILDRMHHMMREAQKRIYLAASSERIACFEPELSELLAKKVKVVLLSDREPSGLKGAVFYRSEGKAEQVRLISDSRYVLTGELTGSRQDICLYSGQKVLVDALKEAMRNEIKLIELTGRKKKTKGEA